jgi:hypothetical protein
MPLNRRAPSRALLVAGLVFSAAAITCSAGGGFQGGGDTTLDGSIGGGSGALPGDAGPNFTATAGTGEHDGSANCGLITEEAKASTLNLYIALDKSSSMAGDSKWTKATAGLEAFLGDPASAGVRVALNFFPLDNNPTCDQHAYQAPIVPFGALPQNAAPITKALGATTPNGFSTPIYPALGGALLGARAESQKAPGQTGAVLLVTDGQPQGPSTSCGMANPEDPAAIATLAKSGLSTFSVKTFVIGLPGVNQAIANQIAAAGGSSEAILVDSVDVQSAFQSALAAVRGTALRCEYNLPAKTGEVGIGNINVQITPKDGQAGVLPQDPDCKGPGWRYDDPSMPTRISFCPQSCDALKVDFSAKVQIELGCATQVVK